MLKFDNYIDTIFIMLGFGCNFHCRYCLQHAYKDVCLDTKINDDIIDFIKSVHKSNKENHQNDNLTLNFFGGEPMVYKKQMYEIVNRLRGENISYSMISNGSLITKEDVKFLNKNKFSVSISWDGRNTKKTRLIDVFETNKENLFSIDKFGISGVMSALNYPKEFLEDIHNLNEEYFNYSQKWMFWMLDKLYDLNNEDRELYDINFDTLYSQIDEMCINYFEDNGKNYPVQNDYIHNMVENIKGYKEFNGKNKLYSPCSNGRMVLNMDLNGNLYLCHNTTDYILGNIYSQYEDYNEKYKESNKVPFFFRRDCVDCNVRFLCNGGCMLVGEEERKKFYCNLQKATYMPIIKNILEYSKKV